MRARDFLQTLKGELVNENPKAQPPQPVLVIMGVSGSGKSTVAGILAGQLGWDLAEGDDLHPAARPPREK